MLHENEDVLNIILISFSFCFFKYYNGEYLSNSRLFYTSICSLFITSRLSLNNSPTGTCTHLAVLEPLEETKGGKNPYDRRALAA